MKTKSKTVREIILSLLLVGDAPSFVVGIFGGTATKPRRYPYAVSLQSDDGTPFCGGSLVAPDVVLSAAHCRRGRRNWFGRRTWMYKAIFGRQILDERNEGGEYGVKRELLHPRFRMGGHGGNVELSPDTYGFEMDYDFMLVFLDQSASDDDAALVNLNSNAAIPANRAPLTVMGWGDTAIGHGEVPSNRLMEATGYVLSNQECTRRKSDKVSYEGAVTYNELCADEYDGYEHYERYGGTCDGDSGGPVILRGERPEDDVQVGIVSWGACGTSRELPGVYARVSSQYKWIRGEVCRGSADPPSSFDCPSKIGMASHGNVPAVICGGILVVLATAIALLKGRRRRAMLRGEAESEGAPRAESEHFLVV